MGHLILKGGANTVWNDISLLDESSLVVTFDETAPVPASNILTVLLLSGTTSVTIDSVGTTGTFNFLHQLAEKDNVLTSVKISGPVFFELGSNMTGHSNSGDGVVTDIAATAALPTRIHSSLTLIDASATTGGVAISAGATNTTGAGQFNNGGSLDPNITITYTGLTIKGGAGNDFIENDAKNGVVIDGNGNGDGVLLGGAGAKATLGTGANDYVDVGASNLGLIDPSGSTLGDKVTFGDAATATLHLFHGAEAGSTAGTANIGMTKVVNATAGMKIHFEYATSSNIDHIVFGAPINLTAAENAAVATMGVPGVVFFSLGGSEYFIATNHAETAVSSDDVIVKLVGVHDLLATNSGGVVTLHA